MARWAGAKRTASDVSDGACPPQKRRLSTFPARAVAVEEPDRCRRQLESMCSVFGERPEFNRLLYSDDNVLMTLNVQLKNSRHKASFDVTMNGTIAVCKYDLRLDGGSPVSGTATGASKKTARKNAARLVLTHLSHPTSDELEEITRWMVAGHRSGIGAREEPVSRDFGPSGHVVTLRWRVGGTSFDGRGTSNSLRLAELYALQDLYCQTHALAPLCQAAQSSSAADSDASSVSVGGRGALLSPASSGRLLRSRVMCDELSKADACQMNVMRNTVSSRMKVKQDEVTAPSAGGGFTCTLTWSWTDSSGLSQQKSVCRHGTSKSMAKAAASKAMLVEVGVIDPVTPQESAQATAIRNMLTTNIAKAVQAAAEFLRKTNGSVWRLFLPPLVDHLVQRREGALLSTVLDSVRESEVAVPSDLWESLLSAASTSVDEALCKQVLDGIKTLSLDSRSFSSTKALEYYRTQSWLLTMEFNAEVCSGMATLRGRGGGKDSSGVLCELSKTQLPLLFLKGEITPEYLKAPLKEDDLVLVVPHSGSYQWDGALLCSLSKHKNENLCVSLTCKVINRVAADGSDAVSAGGKHGVFMVTSTTTNRRMFQALQRITHESLPVNSTAQGYNYDKELQRILIEGAEGAVECGDLRSVSLRTNIPLTDAQSEACRSAVSSVVTLIQGPPGTGKTQVACAIIDCWRHSSHEKILAVADSNVAADNLVEGLARRRISALRIGFGSESLLQDESLRDLGRYERYRALRSAGMHKEANSMRVLMIAEAVKQHQVIIATCVGSGNDVLAGYQFPYVVIDECAQSIEASNLIPIGKGCRQLVLIGDHKQLRPTIISPEASSQGLCISLLERLASSKVAPVHLLDIQRRMHPSISEFPNRQFYRGRINDAVAEDSRPPVRGFRWPNRAYNVAFIDAGAGGPNSQFESVVGTSKSNLLEVDILLMVLKSVLSAGDVRESQIGILTPYDAQKWQLKRAVNQLDGISGHRIEIDSVDGFQGKEKELVLFSAVRSNLQKEVGFLRDPRRMNVMLTRARRGLIVIADKYTIMNDHANWRPYVEYMSDRGLEVHISQLNSYLDRPSSRLDGVLRRVRAGSYP